MNTIDPADIDDQCPAEECVVRVDLADDVETPPEYCEKCPLTDCEWEPGTLSCKGVHLRRRKYATELKRYYYRNLRRVEREKVNA